MPRPSAEPRQQRGAMDSGRGSPSARRRSVLVQTCSRGDAGSRRRGGGFPSELALLSTSIGCGLGKGCGLGRGPRIAFPGGGRGGRNTQVAHAACHTARARETSGGAEEQLHVQGARRDCRAAAEAGGPVLQEVAAGVSARDGSDGQLSPGGAVDQGACRRAGPAAYRLPSALASATTSENGTCSSSRVMR